MTELPKGWDKSTLGELVDAIREQSKIENTKTYELWSIPSFSDGAPEIIQGSEIGSAKLKVMQDDLLISKINPRINRVWLVEDSNLEQLASPEWLVARIKDSNEIDKKFLQFYLSSPEFRDWISRAASSVTGSHSRAKANEILQREVPLPPIEEQHKIVELLEDHLSRLDAALVDVKQAKIKAAKFRRSLLQTAFTGNLGSDGTSLMVELPSGWQLSTIGGVADIVRGVTYSKADTLSAADKDAVPLLRATNLEVDTIDFEDMVYVPKRVVKAQQFLQLNDIFLAASSGSISVVGKSAQVVKTNGETFGAFCAVIRPIKIHPKFLAYWVQSPEVRDHWSATAKGTNINNLKPSDISETKIPVPPIEEQHKIVEILEDHLSRLDASVSLTDAMEKQSTGLRCSLLQAAFTGQLTKEVVHV